MTSSRTTPVSAVRPPSGRGLRSTTLSNRSMSIVRAVMLASIAFSAAGCAREADRPADSGAARPAPAAEPAAMGQPAAADSLPAVTEQGIGPLRAGMSLRDASAALGGALTAREGADAAGCDYLAWRGGPPGVRVMIDQGRIARVDVDSGSVATAAGARIGDREDRIRSLYAGRVTVTPHKYNDGRYLTVMPPDRGDSALRIVFETKDGAVTRYRAGRRPAVEYVEGCG